MSRNKKYENKIKRELKAAIAKYNRTGRLPKDHDVRTGSPDGYWGYVDRELGGREPERNAPNAAPRQASTEYRRRFKEWLDTELPRLPKDTQYAFNSRYRYSVTSENIGETLGMSGRSVNRLLEEVKQQIKGFIRFKGE